jgi:DNA-binding GntR family transcriptional regulator
MSLINRNSKLPLYQQVYEILHHNIRVRVWEPGDLIRRNQSCLSAIRSVRSPFVRH